MTLPGCSALWDAAKVPVDLGAAVIDYAAVRCPATDAATHNEWRRTTARPAHWGQPGPDGKPIGAKRGELEDHIDKLELAEARKNGTGVRGEAEYERCRQGKEPASDAKPTS